ncbi:MAG TPA: hypothetical protein VN361_03905 [Oxalicibacterium sp.]|nr:hypothetical protein [Oxalicibacterium sp.]
MKKNLSTLLFCASLLPLLATAGNDNVARFSFGVIAKPLNSHTDSTLLKESLAESDADNLAFVVVNGIKPGNEPCTDTVYQERKSLFDTAKNGLVVSVAASDWATCRDGKRSIAFEQMSRLRDMFFSGDFSFGDSKIVLARQSAMPKFRNYSENMRWRINDVVFATLNLPANDNNYTNAAGRNSEYEDRQIANSDWLQRIFITAKVNKLDGIVLFCDGDPLIRAEHSLFFSSDSRRKGFADIRKQILAGAAKFHGKILIVHNDDAARHASAGKGIIWHGNIGTLHVDGPWRKVTVDASQPALFSLASQPMPMQARTP